MSVKSTATQCGHFKKRRLSKFNNFALEVPQQNLSTYLKRALTKLTETGNRLSFSKLPMVIPLILRPLDNWLQVNVFI